MTTLDYVVKVEMYAIQFDNVLFAVLFPNIKIVPMLQHVHSGSQKEK